MIGDEGIHLVVKQNDNGFELKGTFAEVMKCQKLEKTFIYQDKINCFISKRVTSVSGKLYLGIYDEKNNEPVIPLLNNL